ncbi:PREDICTED: uncharacterized protein LOC108964983 [Bactrocera latifrons]|uniref:uncharacterized protein LOC108964983 n=1 Tax=Bactrocera latifrons TaxID=174628 RepID=UPI0008DCB74D|nr:PREDICTED: uncharacterized protein LOC108964983 [Bactrocera latifrons]
MVVTSGSATKAITMQSTKHYDVVEVINADADTVAFLIRTQVIGGAHHTSIFLMLRCNLECENLRYSEELALFMKNRIEEAARKREQWFGIQRVQREHDKDKFLQLKTLQREMENCEATRHRQSKALLLDTKEAQLHQMKEKEAMRQREKQIDLIWEDVTRRYFEEKAKQDVVEKKLLKTIAGINRNINIKNYECQRKNNKVAEQATREQFVKE